MNFINFLSLQLYKFQETNSTNSTAQTVTVQSPQQSSNQQIIQLQQTQQTPTTQTGGIQIVQQIVTPNGEIQQIPVSSKNLYRMQYLSFCISFFIGLSFFLDSINSTTITNDPYASPGWKQSTNNNTDCSDSNSTTINTSCTRHSSSSFLTNFQY